MKSIIGQYANEDFQNNIRKIANTHAVGKCVIKRGSTINYYIQHQDGSWTNYDCKTVYT